MKNILTIALLLSALQSLAHDLVSLRNVSFEHEDEVLHVKLEVVNESIISYSSVLLEVEFSDQLYSHSFSLDVGSKREFDIEFTTRDSKNLGTDINQTTITVYGDRSKSMVLSSKQGKQVNTLYSEFYADAPWRMPKFDELGNLNGIPVHFFLHDADLDPIQDVKVDNINIKIKNASETSFSSVLTFDTMNTVDFLDLFSCTAQYDGDLDIKAFDLNSFVASSSQTIDFNIDSDFWDEYVNVSNKYWYFTFTVPADVLVGMNDVVDILVQIEYANLTFTDDWIGMRVFRNAEELPAISGYYRGDTHLHSMYTQNDAEIGLPLCATKQAAKHIGLDWITTTDHTSDFDNYGVGIAANWNRIQNEAAAMNLEDSSMIYIAGQEVATKNSISKLVHMLAYPNEMDPFGFPFIGDGQGDIFPTSVTVASALDAIYSVNGFAYAAHPFATEDELPTIPVDGGIWNLGSSDFPINGGSFPSGGSLICNDVSIGSDVFSTDNLKLVKDALVGGQIWNTRKNLKSSADELDAWDVQNQGGGFSQVDTSSFSFHLKRFRQGQDVVNHINRLGLQLKNQNPSIENWKYFYSAGSDAHGSFNYSNTDDFAGLGSISNNAVGKLMTVTYCPDGMGENGTNVLSSLRSGKTTLSDGPLMTIGISRNGNNNPEAIMGETVLLHNTSPENDFVKIEYSNTLEFGEVTSLKLILGSETGEVSMELPVDSITGNGIYTESLTTLIENLTGSANLTYNNYYYLRGELETYKDYDTQSGEFRTNYDSFHSFTNPVWFSYNDLASLEMESWDQFSLYPNPTTGLINFETDALEFWDQIEIVDCTGRVIESVKINALSNNIDLGHIAAGHYSIRVINNQGLSTNIKIIKL